MAEEKKDNQPASAPASPAADQPAAKAAKVKEDKLKLFLAALSPREKTVMRLAGLFMGIVFLDLIIIHPITGYLSALDEEIKIQETIIPKRLMILKHKEAILRDYRLAEPLMTDPNMTQEEEIARLLREVERVSKECNLFIFNINPVKTNKKSEAVYELSVEIEAKGGINQIRHFMKVIEGANPAIRISGFNLRPQSKDSDELKCMLSITKIGVRKNQMGFNE
jgi:hypothetical protein